MSLLPKQVSAGASSLCAIGVDVGGTKIAAGAVTLADGRVHARRIIPTLPQRGGEAVLADVRREVEALAADAHNSQLAIRGIGIGVCELVDLNGHVASANCVAWQGVEVHKQFTSIAPTVIEADVRAAALGEAILGAGRRFKSFLYVTVGTGISSCLVIDGAPFTGARGAAGTIASSALNVVCGQCGQVESRSLEEIAAGPALLVRYHQASSHRVNSAEEVVAAAEKGDPRAAHVVRTGGEALGRTVGLLVNALDPEAVIVGGGLGLSGGLYWESFESSTRKQLWSDLNRQLPIIRAGLGIDAGIIGAAAAAWLKFKPIEP